MHVHFELLFVIGNYYKQKFKIQVHVPPLNVLRQSCCQDKGKGEKYKLAAFQEM